MNPLFIEAIVTFVFSYYLYNKYASRSVSHHISSLVIFVWFLTFFGIFILPLDIYYSCLYEEKKNKNNEANSRDQILGFIRILWNLLYWIIYILSWIIIPIFQEYEASGDFTFIGKLKRSLKRNAIFYSIFLVAGSLFITYLFISQKFTL